MRPPLRKSAFRNGGAHHGPGEGHAFLVGRVRCATARRTEWWCKLYCGGGFNCGSRRPTIRSRRLPTTADFEGVRAAVLVYNGGGFVYPAAP
jgi:hypothetical protein